MSHNSFDNAREQVDRKLNRNVLYHFTIFLYNDSYIMINKILMTKNCRILVFNNFFSQILSTLQKNFTVRNKNCLFFFSSLRTLRIFSEIFNQLFNTAFSFLYQHKKVRY